ncbi:MAG: four helix bundle protein [Bacteroidia bacterium]|nr:four helix bundle protein [Bacteroidia bacterium]
MFAEEFKKRTKDFAINIIKLCRKLPEKHEFRIITGQITRSACSIGANYRSACRAKSGPDFINKLKIVEEETDETIFFLEILKEILPEKLIETDILIKEGNEILSIIIASIITTRNKQNHK